MGDVMEKAGSLAGTLFDMTGKVAVITSSSRGISEEGDRRADGGS